jgi:hypothetical protein
MHAVHSGPLGHRLEWRPPDDRDQHGTVTKRNVELGRRRGLNAR